MPDIRSRCLLAALARRNRLKPYRHYCQRMTTEMLKVPRSFTSTVLWPKYIALKQALEDYLNGVTSRVTSESVYLDASEATEIMQALPTVEKA